MLILAFAACTTDDGAVSVKGGVESAPGLATDQAAPAVPWPQPAQTQAPAARAALSQDPEPVLASPALAGSQASSADPEPVEAKPATAGQAAVSKDPEPSASPAASPAPIQVSKEVFVQTFSEVELLIKNLNALIRARDYEGWTHYLSKEYVEGMSDAEYLRKLSQSATLQKNKIVLRTLQDYFVNVVVPSRANLRLDDLVFLSENVVEAIMVVGNRRVTVYRLIKIDNQWMIGLS